MLLILTDSISARIVYIATLMVKEMLGTEFLLTTSMEEFVNFPGPKIIYSRKVSEDGISIEAAGLLFEQDVKYHEIQCSFLDGTPLIFKSVHPSSALPFDPFAAGFYLVSRYEEYHSHKRDSYGRFPATESIAWKSGFLEIPVVHAWAEMLKRLLRRHYPEMTFTPRRYQFVPTIDVDHAWCFRGRTITRTLGGFGRSMLKGNLADVIGRVKVLAGFSPDPYDTYNFIRSVHEPSGNFPLYFILFADYGMNDNNVTITSKKFHQLLRELDQHGGVGIHPSLSSGRHLLKLEDEYDGLCEVLDRDVTISRQHFLKLSLPRTYRCLLQFGITDDFSMGYASHTGFRAGIAMPFPFFDLSRNEATSMMIHPVSIMDVTLKDYLRLTPVESLEKIEKMIQLIKSVNGEFVSLWHNESLGDAGRWQGWQRVYKEMVKLASS
ncbi:MAG: polysaccharide deacetylase family protein [Bacteroidales bacterium]